MIDLDALLAEVWQLCNQYNESGTPSNHKLHLTTALTLDADASHVLVPLQHYPLLLIQNLPNP